MVDFSLINLTMGVRMLDSSVVFFDRLMRKYTPDPFVLALLLTMTLFVFGITLTASTPKDMVYYWGSGFWNLIPFTLQMVMILVGGYIVAIAPPVNKLLRLISARVKTPGQAVVVITLVALIGSIINWGLGLVIGGLMCRELIKAVPKANFRLLVASSYSGFLVWHGGFSASIPLVIATPGNFTESMIGGTISLSETLFSPFNIAAVAGLIVILPITNWLMSTREISAIERINPDFTSDPIAPEATSSKFPAEWLENSRLLGIITGLLGFTFITIQILESRFNFDLNDINFIFLFLAIILHGNPRSLINAMADAAKRVGPILLQFPFYAGIMGMMTSSKLGDVISNAFIQIANPDTLPLLTFYSAGIINLFVPSGGGQWAVQAPVVIAAAKELGVDMSRVAMAVSWGDAWTNMLQPFWALPLLAIAGIKLRDIMGYCIVALIVSGVLLSVLFITF